MMKNDPEKGNNHEKIENSSKNKLKSLITKPNINLNLAKIKKENIDSYH